MKYYFCIFDLSVNRGVMAITFTVSGTCTIKTADGISFFLQFMAGIYHNAVRCYLVPKKSMFIKDHFLSADRRIFVF